MLNHVKTTFCSLKGGMRHWDIIRHDSTKGFYQLGLTVISHLSGWKLEIESSKSLDIIKAYKNKTCVGLPSKRFMLGWYYGFFGMELLVWWTLPLKPAFWMQVDANQMEEIYKTIKEGKDGKVRFFRFFFWRSKKRPPTLITLIEFGDGEGNCW